MEPAAVGALYRPAAGIGTAASEPIAPAFPLDGLHSYLSAAASWLDIVFPTGYGWNQGMSAGIDWAKSFRLMGQSNFLFAAAQRGASRPRRLLCRPLDRPLDGTAGVQEQHFFSSTALFRLCGAACPFHCISHWSGPCGTAQSLKRKGTL